MAHHGEMLFFLVVATLAELPATYLLLLKGLWLKKKPGFGKKQKREKIHKMKTKSRERQCQEAIFDRLGGELAPKSSRDENHASTSGAVIISSPETKKQ